MYLIAKNKIADYIKQHPEAQTSFLVWLKEFPYRETKRSFNYSSKEFPPQLVTTVESQFGNSNYKIRYCVNSFLKTAYIDWVGTANEFNAHLQNERKNRQALYPDTKIDHKVKITHVTLRPPGLDELVKNREVIQAEIIPADQPNKLEVVSDQANDFLLNTIADYEAGLARAISIFSAGPATAKLLELGILIPQLVHYENRFIPFPELDPLTVIKLKMQERGMGEQYPLDLINLIGSREELVAFLSGEKPLTKQALRIFYNYLKIDFMAG